MGGGDGEADVVEHCSLLIFWLNNVSLQLDLLGRTMEKFGKLGKVGKRRENQRLNTGYLFIWGFCCLSDEAGFATAKAREKRRDGAVSADFVTHGIERGCYWLSVRANASSALWRGAILRLRIDMARRLCKLGKACSSEG